MIRAINSQALKWLPLKWLPLKWQHKGRVSLCRLRAPESLLSEAQRPISQIVKKRKPRPRVASEISVLTATEEPTEREAA